MQQIVKNIGADVSVRILCFSKADHEYSVNCTVDYLRHDGFGTLGKYFNLIWRSKKIADYVAKGNYDHILSFMEPANIPVILSKLCGVKAKLHVSVRTNLRYNISALSRLAVKFLYRFADFIISNSEANAKYLDKWGLRDVVCIPNMVELNPKKTSPIKENLIWGRGLKFISIGRFTLATRQWHLLRIFSEIVKTYPDSKLVLIGGGEMESDIRKFISELNLNSNVQVLNFKKNVIPYLVKADCF